MLAGLIQAHGQSGKSEGAYFGWWNFRDQAQSGAGCRRLRCPLLGLFGYEPGARDASALGALVIAYCVLPCLLKLCAAAAALYFFVIKQPGRFFPMNAFTIPGARAACRFIRPGAVAPRCWRAAPGPKVSDYAAEKPVLDLRQYFNGTIDAHGVFTNRSGKVVQTLHGRDEVQLGRPAGQ